MKEVRLTYYSRPSPTFRFVELQGILAAGRAFNIEHNITSVLGMTQTHFLQALEGPRDTVCQAFTRVIADHRHHQITLYGMRDIDQRLYQSGPMDFVCAKTFDKEFCQRLTNRPQLVPSLLSFECSEKIIGYAFDEKNALEIAEELLHAAPIEDAFEISV